MSLTLKANYNLEVDARAQAQARADKGRAFALLLRVHHRDMVAAPGQAGAQAGAHRPKPVLTGRNAQEAPKAAFCTVVVSRPPTTVAKGSAPCALPQEILELIMRVLGALTLDEVLRENQRWAFVSNVTDVNVGGYAQHRVRGGFPSAGEDDNGYRWIRPCLAPAVERVLTLEVVQAVAGVPFLAYTGLHDKTN